MSLGDEPITFTHAYRLDFWAVATTSLVTHLPAKFSEKAEMNLVHL